MRGCGVADGFTAPESMEKIADLVAKSLVVAVVGNTAVHYRLFDTTRVYLVAKLRSRGEFEQVVRLHAEYQLALHERADLSASASQGHWPWLETYGCHVDDVRSSTRLGLLRWRRPCDGGGA